MNLEDKFNIKLIENYIRTYYKDPLIKKKFNEFFNNNNNFNKTIGYVEGPPTMNGEPHIGHLRGRIIKDLWYRKNILERVNIVFRAGWDSQGLPVELNAEKVLGLTGNKSENLKKVGIEKLVETCKKIIFEYNKKWIDVDNMLGMSYDYDHAYWTFHDSYIEREWKYIQKAYELDILKERFRVVAYCPSCQTSLSNSEINQSYEQVEDPSFFYKVKLKNEDVFLIVWTTMPFTVITDDFVDITTGSGIVHLSPANGEQDFDIALKRNLPIFVPIDDRVIFTKQAGKFSNLFVRDADEIIVNEMYKSNAVVKVGKIIHSYPTCWRSHHKIVWLARREYFYMIDKLDNKIIDAANKVNYFFEHPKNRYIEIIKEQVPWCISRERVWGTPLPIWNCGKCGSKEPLFSRNEIIKRASKLPDGEQFELHRPWIDNVGINCLKCNVPMRRESFVLDTWHNSGASPYASFSDDEYKKLIPAAFLTEGIDQTRGWAYTLLIENVIMQNKDNSPFKSFLFQGHILDEKGNKMSKSLGNVLDANDLLVKHSVDAIRFYFMWKASPIESLNFSLNEMSSRPYQVLSTLYYLHVYLIQNSVYDKFDTRKINLDLVLKSEFITVAEAWILSKLQSLIETVTTSLDSCRFNEGAKAFEEFIINHLSQTYVPMTRDVIWDDNMETLERRHVIYAVLGYTLSQIDIMLHSYCPIITDYLYLLCFKKKERVILESWPNLNSKLKNTEIEVTLDRSKKIISLVNAARMKAKFKRRWPISRIVICIDDESILESKELSNILKKQLNTMTIDIKILNFSNFHEKVNSLYSENLVSVNAKPRINKIAPRLKNDLAKAVQAFEKIN